MHRFSRNNWGRLSAHRVALYDDLNGFAAFITSVGGIDLRRIVRSLKVPLDIGRFFEVVFRKTVIRWRHTPEQAWGWSWAVISGSPWHTGAVLNLNAARNFGQVRSVKRLGTLAGLKTFTR